MRSVAAHLSTGASMRNRMAAIIGTAAVFLAAETALASGTIRLKNQSFDPKKVDVAQFTNSPVWSSKDRELFIIQFNDKINGQELSELRMLGIQTAQYIPDNAYLVRMTGNQAQAVKSRAGVRWVGPFLTKFKNLPRLQNQFANLANKAASFDIVMVDRNDRNRLIDNIEATGARVLNRNEGSILVEAELNDRQLAQVLRMSEVLWAEPTTKIELDMDNARIQGGGNYVETVKQVPGYTGYGIRGHIMEGINPDHEDFAPNDFRQKPIAVDDASFSSHGQATYGIVFGDGKGNAKARGMMPNGQGFYTAYDTVMNAPEGNREAGSRYELVRRLMSEHQVMFQTASWGYARTLEYNARSAEMDRLIFDLDIPVTQSQSNSGDRNSRPQAWSKNIISVGAVYHHNNADPSDDSWDNYGASIGPATDGRIKPDLCAYYDDIEATAQSGYEQFGGTSGATPIVAGHLGLTLEMWTDGIFGNDLPNADGDRFSNRPHATTAKALMINTADQYKFEGAQHMLTRVHQGWGFPSLKNLYDNRSKIFVVNETDVLKVGQKKLYNLTVGTRTPELKITMTFADPEGNVAAEQDRINNLDLKVTSPTGKIYLGNVGLLAGNYSTEGGQADSIDTVENVFVKEPAAGTWKIEVIATEINADGRPETSEMDADYALVVNGITRK
jgi:serine protease AprX